MNTEGQGTSMNKYQRAYDALVDGLVTGVLLPGERVVEEVWAARLEMSRTPIREALTRLAMEGVVVYEGSTRRMSVRVVPTQDVLDMYETRALLEGEAASLSAERATEEERKAIVDLANSLSPDGDHSPSVVTQSNLRFHQAIWRSAHNAPLLRILEQFTVHVGMLSAVTLSQPERESASVTEHMRLARAIRDGFSVEARSAAQTHLRNARDLRSRLVARQTANEASSSGREAAG